MPTEKGDETNAVPRISPNSNAIWSGPNRTPRSWRFRDAARLDPHTALHQFGCVDATGVPDRKVGFWAVSGAVVPTLRALLTQRLESTEGIKEKEDHDMAAMTWKKLLERVRSGRGSGHGDAYKPWLWIRKKNPSARGNQVVDAMPGYRRASHFLALVEWHVALLCLFLGARDVREQFPLWPMPHPHPLSDLHVSGILNPYHGVDLRGLLTIAREAGIAHGVEIGSNAVPYVATLDLALTLVTKSGLRWAGISLKRHEEIISAEPTARIIERLEMENRYLLEAGAHFKILDSSFLGKFTGGNLVHFSSAWCLPSHLRDPELIETFCRRFVEVATRTNIDEGIRRAGVDVRLQSQFDSSLLWRHGVWTRRIPVDITRQIEPGCPLRVDTGDITSRMAMELFGEEVL
jgi:hypothetical protein